MLTKAIFTKTMFLKFLAGASALLALGGCDCSVPSSPGDKPAPDSQVKGDVVYNLGQGAMANSSAVLLAGGFTRSRLTRLAGGIEGCCPNPVPQAYWDAVRENRPLAIYGSPKGSGIIATTTALTPAAPAAAATPAARGEIIDWEPAPTALPGYTDGESYPVYPESRIICQPGENLSDCYTLPEDGAEAIETIVPAAGRELDVTPATPAQPERIVPTDREEALTPPPAVAARAAEVVEVVEAVESVQTVEPVAPAMPAPIAAPAPISAPAPIAVPEPIVAPSAAVTAETVKAEVAAAFDPTEPVARASVTDIMPPVPAVADFDAAIDAILSRDGDVAGGQGLPEVQLPPQLQ